MKPNRKHLIKQTIKSSGFVFISIVAALLVWSMVTHWSDLPAFILPSPMQVFRRFWVALLDSSLLRHSSYTLLEVGLGLTAGSILATLTGYLLAKSPALERLVSPYLVASQAIPVVAVAPLLVIWFGPGLFSKVLIAGLIVFFPVLVNTVVGVRAVSKDYYDLMRSLRASRWQILKHLEIPAALPVFFWRLARRGDSFGNWCRCGRICWRGSRIGFFNQCWAWSI